MPNQSNYPQPLTTLVDQRPTRMLKVDEDLLVVGKKTTLFGTDGRDVVELWLYNPDGTFAANDYIHVNDSALGLTTLIDNTGAYEFVNMNLQKLANDVGISPGRYSMTANFFRNEVGSSNTYQLYISDISDDRTEVKLSALVLTEQINADIAEFVIPSVPRLPAQALIDATFGKAIQENPQDVMSVDVLKIKLQELISDTLSRITYADADGALSDEFNAVVQLIRDRAIDNLVNDATNIQVQRVELRKYVSDALDSVIHDMEQHNLFDYRFQLI